MKMKLFKTLIYIGSITCILSSRAYTSEANFLTWKSVSAEFSHGVSIKIEADGPIYKKFIINAFDKSFELNQKDLNKIEGLSLSLLNATHETGYEEVGGETISFKLSNYIFARYGDKIKTAVLTVQKGGITISEQHLNPPN
jgi:hypothetical protein